jgi:tetratricopeptide (TPR) repeat protein
LHGLGHFHAQIGDRDTARKFFDDALALRRRISYASGIATTLISLARLEAEDGNTEDASRLLEEAHAIARETKSLGSILDATVEHARLPGGDVGSALATLHEHEARVDHAEKTDARFRLWQLTNDKPHLIEAKRLLDFAVEHAPEDCRASMLEKVPLHRDIMKAWEEHGQKGA